MGRCFGITNDKSSSCCEKKNNNDVGLIKGYELTETQCVVILVKKQEVMWEKLCNRRQYNGFGIERENKVLAFLSYICVDI